MKRGEGVSLPSFLSASSPSSPALRRYDGGDPRSLFSPGGFLRGDDGNQTVDRSDGAPPPAFSRLRRRDGRAALGPEGEPRGSETIAPAPSVQAAGPTTALALGVASASPALALVERDQCLSSLPSSSQPEGLALLSRSSGTHGAALQRLSLPREEGAGMLCFSKSRHPFSSSSVYSPVSE